MQRKPNPRTLVAAFLISSATISILILSVRNLFDDELFSLDLITGPIHNILSIIGESDVHPPGMYLLAHFAWRILPSFRWMNLFPLAVLYAGLAIFLFQITPLFTRTRSQICLLLFATLHPQLLMWSTTFRWYSWWTGFALIAVTVSLQLRESHPRLTIPRSLAIALLLSCLFYLNYITLLFAFALGVAIFLRYRTQPRRQIITNALCTIGVFTLLIAPQLHTMLSVHIPDGYAQRYGIAASTLRLLQSVIVSEAYLPWHPLAIVTAVLIAGLCIRSLLLLLRRHREQAEIGQAIQHWSANINHPEALTALITFGLLFVLLIAASGLGGKPRSGLLLIPVLAPIAALIMETLRPRTQTSLLLFLTLWSATGISHLINRQGLTKATMNDRPKEVVNFVAHDASQPTPTCSVVATYDSALAFELTQAHLPHTLIISPYRGHIFSGAPTLPASECTTARLYTVRSYLGGSIRTVYTYDHELENAERYITGPRTTNAFSFDPDAATKRRLSHLPGLGSDAAAISRTPDYRYTLTSGDINPANLETMRRSMPHFPSGHTTGTNQDQ